MSPVESSYKDQHTNESVLRAFILNDKTEIGRFDFEKNSSEKVSTRDSVEVWALEVIGFNFPLN